MSRSYFSSLGQICCAYCAFQSNPKDQATNKISISELVFFNNKLKKSISVRHSCKTFSYLKFKHYKVVKCNLKQIYYF